MNNMESGISNTDKLLICLAIILLLTIVWTILIGIMYKMRESKKVTKVNKFIIEDDEKVVKKTTRNTKKKSTKKTTKKSTKRVSAAKTKRVIKSSSNQETYVKVRFYRTKKDLIYVAPENVILRKGEKIKVRTDEGAIRTATVAEGNYTRDKYKTYKYQVLDLVE